MTNEWKDLERFNDGEEWVHLLIKEMAPVFDVGSTITIQPLDSGTGERFTPYTLELVER